VPTKKVSAVIGYHSTSENDIATIDVVFDGKPAFSIDKIEHAPQWSYWSLIKVPVIVFATGLGFTLLIGLIVVIRSNPKLQEAILLIFKELNPTVARVTDILMRTTMGL
jgi:hypothetical protein